MIKLKFYNVDAISTDTFTLQIPKGYIHNFAANQSNSYAGQNDRYTIYEKYKSIDEQISVPNFDDIPSTGIKRTYQCSTIPNLTLTMTFSKFSDTQIANTGVKGVQSDCQFKWGTTTHAYLNFGFQYPKLYQTTNQYQTNGMYPPINLGYDDINEVLFVMGKSKFTITHLHRTDEEVTVPYSKLIGVSEEPQKGDYPMFSPMPQFEGKAIATNQTFSVTDIGKSIHYWYFRHEPVSANSLYNFLLKAGVKPTYPDGDDDDDFPDGDDDDDSDDIEPTPIFPTSATGFVSLYAPSQSQLRELASFMWSKNFLDILLKLQQNPYDAIISIKNICCDIETGGTSNIILGNVETDISCATISQQYQQIDCGTINLNRYFGNFLDFNPYTSIKIYLPFIGFRELDVDEVMGATLHLYYNVDVLTGSCVALIKVSKNVGGTNLNSVLYQFDGMIANEIPVTANDYSNVVSAIIRGAATTAAAIGVTAATGGTGAVAGGALLGSATAGEAATAAGTFMAVNSAIDTVTSKINVQHGGSLSGSMGVLATKQPYVIIHRVIEKNPSNYAKLHGIPSNAYKKLSSLKGFTKMQDIQISSTIGSVDETEEIKQLLLGGVVI